MLLSIIELIDHNERNHEFEMRNNYYEKKIHYLGDCFSSICGITELDKLEIGYNWDNYNYTDSTMNKTTNDSKAVGNKQSKLLTK